MEIISKYFKENFASLSLTLIILLVFLLSWHSATTIPSFDATPFSEKELLVKMFNGDIIKDENDQYKNNPDTTNREIAFGKIFEEVMLKNRRNEMELYKLLAADEAFKSAMQQSLKRVVGL